MGPVEVVFLTVVAIFGLIGIVRGYQRELGVTVMLLLALFVIELIEDQFGGRLNSVIGFIFGNTPQQIVLGKAILYSIFLFIILFISYQGVTLAFPGGGSNPVLSFLVGVLNGYLFVGSIWYYLDKTGWPVPWVCPCYTPLYQALVRILPPAILTWPFLLLLLTILLILRVWR